MTEMVELMLRKVLTAILLYFKQSMNFLPLNVLFIGVSCDHSIAKACENFPGKDWIAHVYLRLKRAS